MAKKLQFKRSQNVGTYTPAMGEPIFDISRSQLRIGNDVAPGGLIPKEVYFSPVSTEQQIAAEAETCAVVDCRANPVQITLPSPAGLRSGSTVRILDAYYAATPENPITIVGQSAKIDGESANYIIDIPRTYITFIYIAELANWIVDLGGVIAPPNELDTTSELAFDKDGRLGLREVPMEKLFGSLDLGTF